MVPGCLDTFPKQLGSYIGGYHGFGLVVQFSGRLQGLDCCIFDHGHNWNLDFGFVLQGHGLST